MSQNTNMQERYSAIVEAKLRATSIFAGLFNSRHEGSPAAGAVKVPYRSEATVGNYNIANGGTLTAPSTSYRTIVCDKDLYVNELIDGYMAAAVPDGLVAERLDSAGFMLGDTIDNALITMLTTAGNYTASDFSGTLSAETVYGAIVDDIQAAKAAKVNPASIWVAVSPAVMGMLSKCSEFVYAAANVGELGAGYRGSIMGVPVYESINMSGDHYIVGNSEFCYFVNEWMVPVAVNDLADGAHIGASAVQGRIVYGALVGNKDTVIYL